MSDFLPQDHTFINFINQAGVLSHVDILIIIISFKRRKLPGCLQSIAGNQPPIHRVSLNVCYYFFREADDSRLNVKSNVQFL